MTRDDGTPESTGGSLAEQAAAWVPPWSRPAEPQPADDAETAVDAQERGPVPETDWDWDDPDTSDTLDIAEALTDSEEPALEVVGEPGERAVAVVEPVPAGESVVAEEPLPPAEPLEPAEPLPPSGPEGESAVAGEPVSAGESVVAAEPLEPAEPLPPLEPAEPLVPGEPVLPGEPLDPLVPEEPFVPDEPLLGAAAVAEGSDGSTVAEGPSRASPIDKAGSETQLAAVPAAELKGALEAILLVVDEPVGEIMLAQIIEQPTERIVATLRELAAEYDEQQRGFELRSVAGGWRFYTRTTYAPYVERFVLDGQQVRLTQAALETLAVIAYKQPVTRSRISAIRGVNCDGVVRTLLSRGLVEECGSEPDSGAHLYRTTTLFLEKLGLNSVDELPPLAPFLPDDVEALADAP